MPFYSDSEDEVKFAYKISRAKELGNHVMWFNESISHKSVIKTRLYAEPVPHNQRKYNTVLVGNNKIRVYNEHR